MFYDVLINYSLRDQGYNWKRLSFVEGFSRVLYLLKDEIKSSFVHVYVRKLQSNKFGLCTNFKHISSLSYTFAHYPELSNYKNHYLVECFDSLKDSYISFCEFTGLKHENFN